MICILVFNKLYYICPISNLFLISSPKNVVHIVLPKKTLYVGVNLICDIVGRYEIKRNIYFSHHIIDSFSLISIYQKLYELHSYHQTFSQRF